jgi:hypothetical protein
MTPTAILTPEIPSEAEAVLFPACLDANVLYPAELYRASFAHGGRAMSSLRRRYTMRTSKTSNKVEMKES